MLIELIEQFEGLSKTLVEAVLREDDELVASIDDRLNPLMRRILLLRAVERADIDRQFAFFADLAVRNCEDAASVRRYTDMMRQLSVRYLDGAGTMAPGAGYDATLQELLLDSLPERVAVIGRDYRYIYTNARNARFHGAEASHFIGRHLREMIGEERFQSRAKAHLDTCFSGETVAYSYRLEDRQGEIRHVDCRMIPLSGADQKILGAVLVLSMQPLHARAENTA